ncbi:GNAT family N-acetyltransferase [Sorangium sp. So ce119]
MITRKDFVLRPTSGASVVRGPVVSGDVVTHREHRRRGFGARVVRHALAEAWEAGCYKAMLLTGSQRPEVHRFYEACGFRAGDKTGFVARPGAAG